MKSHAPKIAVALMHLRMAKGFLIEAGAPPRTIERTAKAIRAAEKQERKARS